VTAGLDEGTIVTQDVARVSPGDTPVTIARRGRDLEALVLSTAVRAHLEHRVIAYSGRTVSFDEHHSEFPSRALEGTLRPRSRWGTVSRWEFWPAGPCRLLVSQSRETPKAPK
jgi:hypothetical protein